MPSRFKTPTTENTEHRRAFCSFLEFFKSGEREVGKIGGSGTDNLARGSMETTKMDGNFRTFKILETHRFLGVFRRQKIVYFFLDWQILHLVFLIQRLTTLFLSNIYSNFTNLITKKNLFFVLFYVNT